MIQNLLKMLLDEEKKQHNVTREDLKDYMTEYIDLQQKLLILQWNYKVMEDSRKQLSNDMQNHLDEKQQTIEYLLSDLRDYRRLYWELPIDEI